MKQTSVRIFRAIVRLLLCTLVAQSLAFATQPPMGSAVVKQKVEKRGVGKSLKIVEVDGTKLSGRVVSIGTNSFTLEAKGAPQPNEIAYAQVREIRNTGLSTGAKVAIIVTAGVGVAVVVAVIVFEKTFKIGPTI